MKPLKFDLQEESLKVKRFKFDLQGEGETLKIVYKRRVN